MAGVILIISCQKYKLTRLRELSLRNPEYANWKVLCVVGDPTLSTEYILDDHILTVRCEDSYLHLLKKTLLGFKIALQLVPAATGILKAGDDIVFHEPELIRFLMTAPKSDYMGNLGGREFLQLKTSHRDTWIVDYYRRHDEDFSNPLHGMPSREVVHSLVRVPTIQAISGPLTYFSRKSCDILIRYMDANGWDVLREIPPYGFPFVIEEPGISFILYHHGITPTAYPLFTESPNEFSNRMYVGLHTNSYKWELPKQVCILGAGWYGCHAALVLQRLGASVTLVDREGIFAGASSKNQNRLHRGYHYPRSPETIAECRSGHEKFLASYGDCVAAFPQNYYLIHKDSKVSSDDYRRIFQGWSHTEHSISEIGMRSENIDHVIFAVDEKFINNPAAKKRMERDLGSILILRDSPRVEIRNSDVLVDGVSYDFVLNCTNNQYVPVPIPYSPTYETVASFLYTAKGSLFPLGLTLMDGPFFSLFPYDIAQETYTLTHVVHSVLARGPTGGEPLRDIDDARAKAEAEVRTVFPTLLDELVYTGYFTSKKTKYEFVTDDRSIRMFRQGRYLSVSGGKITGIFEMEPTLRKMLEGSQM